MLVSKGRLTPIMAFFTRSFLMRPTLNRFSTNSRLVEPEQYHAIEYLFAVFLDASARAVLILSMQGGNGIVLFSLSRCR